MLKIRKVLIWSLIAGFVITGSVAFAAAGSEASEGDDGPVELTVWFGRENFIPDDNFAAFRAEYDNIIVNVDVIPLEQALTEASTALSAGKGPDILQTDSRRIPPLVQANLLQEIEAQLALWRSEDPASYNNVSSSGWNHATHDGKRYGVALSAGPFNHVYRLDWLNAANLDVPTTWEEVLDVARALKTDSQLGYSIRGANSTVWFSSHYMSMGGTYDENNVIQLNSEAGIYALNFYQTLVREELVSPDVLAWGSGDMRAAFITGRAAQAPIGNNIFPSIQEELEYGVQWAAVPPPKREGAEDEYRYASLGWPHVVTSASENLYEASLVLRYLAEHEHAMSIALRYQPTTIMSVWDDPAYIDQKPWARDFADPLKNMTRTPPNLYITDMDEIILDALGEVMSDMDADPAEVAARYQLVLDDLF